jgi:glutaredoxin
MSKYNRENIDRKTNKPNPKTTEGLTPDLILNRANQTRRDDDIIRTAKRTLYDIDFAIKWYIDNEIQPQIIDKDILITVPVIFANGEKWDNVRRLGYLRDEKGILQSPLIMLKRNSTVERDNTRTLDVNRMPSNNFLTHKANYNSRNRYEDDLFPIPLNRKKFML